MNKQGSFIAAMGGHLKDLANMASFKIANPHSWSKYRQLKAVGKRTQADCLIETGTYLGNTTMRCSRVFKKVYTIELDQTLFEKASAYLASRDNVECIQGDATVELPKVLDRADCTNAVIFLDGHFSKGDTAHGDMAEPACELLSSLASYKDKIKGIVVDDFRLFGIDAGWPKKSELIKSAEDCFGDFSIAVHLDQLVLELQKK